MPAGDHTGPTGQGPRTGRAAGFCAGHDMPGYMNPIFGRGRGGFGRGRGGGFGGGRGWRHRFYATGLTGWQRGGRGFSPPGAFEPPMSREEELQRLRADLECLEESAERMRHRITELSAAVPQTSQA